MLLCDGCGTGWHTHCLKPPLTVPAGAWVCPECISSGITAEQLSVKPLPEAAIPAPQIFLSADQRRHLAAAAALDGRTVRRKYTDPVTLEDSMLRGEAHFLGQEARPKAYEVRYTDGSTERMSLSELRKHLTPEPANDRGRRSSRTALAVSTESLPDKWDLGKVAGVRGALAKLMPHGEPSANLVGRLVNRVPAGPLFLQRDGQATPNQPECVSTIAAELEPLLQVVDFSKCTGVLDPWSGTGTVARVFRQKGYMTYRNDVFEGHEAERHEDALQPGFYRRVQDVWSYDAIVASPWFAMLDLALPLAVSFAPVVAFHVPGHYVTDAHDVRRGYLQSLAKAGRLALIMGLPRGRMGKRCMWVVVFASRCLRKQMLRTSEAVDGPWVMM